MDGRGETSYAHVVNMRKKSAKIHDKSVSEEDYVHDVQHGFTGRGHDRDQSAPDNVSKKSELQL